MKKKRIIGILLVVIMSISACLASTAADTTIDKQVVSLGGVIQDEVKKSDLSENVLQRLDSVGVVLKNDSDVKIVSVKENPDATAMVITNSVGEYITKDIIMSFDENGDVGDITSVGDSMIQPREGSSRSTTYSNKVTIRLVAAYNQKSYKGIINSLVQPVGAYYIYNKINSCTVSYINATYYCVGIEYLWEEDKDGNVITYEIVNGETYEHTVTLNTNNPAEDTYYTATNPYRTDRVLFIGSDVGVQMFAVNFKVDGVTKTVDLFL